MVSKSTKEDRFWGPLLVAMFAILIIYSSIIAYRFSSTRSDTQSEDVYIADGTVNTTDTTEGESITPGVVHRPIE